MISFNYAFSSSDHTALNGLIVQNQNGFRSGCDVQWQQTSVCLQAAEESHRTSASSRAGVPGGIQICYVPNTSHMCYHLSHFDLFAQIQK
jgi:hypothetical protein